MTLPNDVCRCIGMRCDMRKQCARFTAMPRWGSTSAEAHSVSYVARLCQTPELEFFIPSEDVSE